MYYDEPRFGFAWGGRFGREDDEPWQPWARPERRGFGPRFGWRGGRGFGPRFGWGDDRGFGPGFGPGFGRRFGPPAWGFGRPGPFGPGPRRGMGPRMFGRGDLKYALLELLLERPKHGYEMIKELEERSGGFYTPSAGAIYPTLQLLEDRSWVTSEQVEGKKVYTITEDGRRELQAHHERRPEFGGPPWAGRWGGHEHEHEHEHEHGRGHHGHEHWRGPFGREMRPELRELGRESMEVARLMRAAVLASGGDPERLTQLRGIVERARGELYQFLGQSREQSRPAGEATTAEPGDDNPIEQL